jgi:hypothetical protein
MLQDIVERKLATKSEHDVLNSIFPGRRFYQGRSASQSAKIHAEAAAMML